MGPTWGHVTGTDWKWSNIKIGFFTPPTSKPLESKLSNRTATFCSIPHCPMSTQVKAPSPARPRSEWPQKPLLTSMSVCKRAFTNHPAYSRKNKASGLTLQASPRLQFTFGWSVPCLPTICPYRGVPHHTVIYSLDSYLGSNYHLPGSLSGAGDTDELETILPHGAHPSCPTLKNHSCHSRFSHLLCDTFEDNPSFKYLSDSKLCQSL